MEVEILVNKLHLCISLHSCYLENSSKKICALTGLKLCYNLLETELARAVDVHVMMARAKRFYILIIKGNKLFSFFLLQCFLKEIQNMYSVSIEL